ncbi:hypothetical protein HGRIS_004173 [Hohenbuehelia grisea]|uniref:Transposase n=1 Tax=Hohenbuehelia grisea TaxID=104357 RepID=A0ABR3JIX9_9AGAR
MFHKIDGIVFADTGRPLSWRHLIAMDPTFISEGILQVTADQHSGQAKGLGLYLKDLASKLPLDRFDSHEPWRPIASLNEYDHLRRVFRLCAVHVFRNIKQSPVPDSVKNKMRSLVCLEHADWNATLEAIKLEGGKAGLDWVLDKERCKFAFPGICWAQSLIPLQVWRVGHSNSNLIKGLHADVNREGISCTLLGGMKKGMHFDTMKMKTLAVFQDTGVQHSYERGHVSETASRALKRKSRSQHQILASQDGTIAKRNKRLQGAHLSQIGAATRLEETGRTGDPDTYARAAAAHHRATANYEKALSSSMEMAGKGSGKVGLLLPHGFSAM